MLKNMAQSGGHPCAPTHSKDLPKLHSPAEAQKSSMVNLFVCGCNPPS